MKAAWIFLLIAGGAEWGWPVGLKLGWLLLLAQRRIPMGTAYAVWTGIGAVGTFVIGILVFGDPVTLPRVVCVGLIVAGIVGMKTVSR